MKTVLNFGDGLGVGLGTMEATRHGLRIFFDSEEVFVIPTPSMVLQTVQSKSIPPSLPTLTIPWDIPTHQIMDDDLPPTAPQTLSHLRHNTNESNDATLRFGLIDLWLLGLSHIEITALAWYSTAAATRACLVQ
jgi:hypothetical protein